MEKTQQFTLDLPVDISAEVCRQAIQKFNPEIITDTDTLISFEDRHGGRKLTCTIGLAAATSTTTDVTIVEGAITAIGPLWGRAIDKRISTFRKEIDLNYEAAKKAWHAEKQQLVQAGLLCPACGKLVPEGTRFCPDDGTPLARVCSKCGHGNTPSSKFCVNCGESL